MGEERPGDVYERSIDFGEAPIGGRMEWIGCANRSNSDRIYNSDGYEQQDDEKGGKKGATAAKH